MSVIELNPEPNTQTTCLCGSNAAYADCCGLFHTGEKLPDTAEALMRSRFSAYTLRNAAYLLQTWAVNKRPKAIDFSKENITWLRLEIVDTKKGSSKDDRGTVEFRAYYDQDGAEHLMMETSRFTRINGRWYYLDGVVKAIHSGTTHNQGRNALCHCGSGKKFKRCCGNDSANSAV